MVEVWFCAFVPFVVLRFTPKQWFINIYTSIVFMKKGEGEQEG